jgi:hypothetical protein
MTAPYLRSPGPPGPFGGCVAATLACRAFSGEHCTPVAGAFAGYVL